MATNAKPDELTPMQIWHMVFHPQKGAVAVINDSIKNLCDEMGLLEANLKKYNGLPERIQTLEKKIAEPERIARLEDILTKQVEACREVQSGKNTAKAIEEALEGARLTGAKEQRDSFNRAMLLWGKVLLTVTTLTGVITWFMGIW